MSRDYILYSHDLSESKRVDIRKRTLTLITIGTYRVKDILVSMVNSYI